MAVSTPRSAWISRSSRSCSVSSSSLRLVKRAAIWPVSCDEVRARPARRRWNQESLEAGTRGADSEAAGPVANPFGRTGVAEISPETLSSSAGVDTSCSAGEARSAIGCCSTSASAVSSAADVSSVSPRDASSATLSSSASSPISGCREGATGTVSPSVLPAGVSSSASSSSNESGTRPTSPTCISGGKTSETSSSTGVNASACSASSSIEASSATSSAGPPAVSTSSARTRSAATGRFSSRECGSSSVSSAFVSTAPGACSSSGLGPKVKTFLMKLNAMRIP